MYRLLLMLAFSLAAVTSAYAGTETPLTGDAAWKEYNKLLENYYSLDKAKADHISCRISSSVPQAYIDIIHQKFGNKLTVDVNPRDFSVTYDRTKGVSVNSPHIKVSISNDVEHAAAEQLENHRKYMEEYLGELVSEVGQAIADRFNKTNMISPNPERLKNLSFTKYGDASVFSFDEDENKHITNTYSGSTGRQTEITPTFSVTSSWDTQPLNGKLALSHLVVERTMGSQKTNIAQSTSYQGLGSAFVPAHISVDTTVIEGARQIKLPRLEIDFKDCKTSDVSP